MSNAQNKYIILYQQDNSKKELNVWVNIKTKNRKQLKVKALIDSEYIHTGINEQLVKNK